MLKLKKDAFLNTEQVGQWLGYSARTVTELAQRWHDSGGREGIPGFKIGRAWRFDPDELELWLSKKQRPPNSVPALSPGDEKVPSHA